MAEPARHLHVVHPATGEAEVACADCFEKDKRLAAAWRKITQLENEKAAEEALAPDAKAIREVLEFWRPLCMPRAKIVVKSERWQKTKARLADKDITTGEYAYTPLHLKAAVVGAKLSPNHVENHWLDASTIFRDSTTVDKHIARCVSFKREVGVSALEIVDELMGPGLAKLAARCSCGHLRLDHEKDRPELDLLDPPCAVHGCHCAGFDDMDWRVEVWMRNRDELVAREEHIA